MNILDIIEKKKNKLALTKEEITYFVNEYTSGNIPDYQMSTLLMSIVINGMNKEETTNLTLAMTNSGDKMNLEMFNNLTVDKHSTGGIGDKVTLIVAPIVACLDCYVAKMSGKGLGYTGGTIDKLLSIPNFKVEMSEEEFIKQVQDINIAIISQTKNIAPADKKIYALRDVTGTVESIPLIASSIMSKKIASGARNLVLDVKVGNGAFMKTIESATSLGQAMVEIGSMCNINTIAILTNMNKPLGNNIGNYLEVKEALEILSGNGNNDLKEVSLLIASYMVKLTKNISLEEAKQLVLEVYQNGKALDKFKQFIQYQGGSLEQFGLIKPLYEYKIYTNKTGYINSINSEQIGKISVALGAGRLNKEDEIDYTAGIVMNKNLGNYVKENDLLATLYSSRINKFEELETKYLETLIIEEIDNGDLKNIYEVIEP